MDPSPDAAGVIGGKAHRPGDFVGTDEADAIHLVGQGIRVLLHLVDRRRAVVIEDTHGHLAGDAKTLQINHRPAYGAVFLPALDQADGLFMAEAADLEQAIRLFIQHARGVVAKVIDDALGRLLAHAGRNAASEKRDHAFFGRGHNLGEAVHTELRAVFGLFPLADELEALAGIDLGQHANDRERAVARGVLRKLAVRLDFDHAVAVVGVVERDPLNRANDDFRTKHHTNIRSLPRPSYTGMNPVSCGNVPLR